MADTVEQSRPAPRLRLVGGNPRGFRPLMAIHTLDRQRAAIDRRLRRPGTDPQVDARLRRQRALIAAILAARPFEPRRARRLEQELRWLVRADTTGVQEERTGLVRHLGHGVRALLSTVLRPLLRSGEAPSLPA
jgi:hypothetical protein